MKPLKLVMRAFGPYAGETTIDFEKLDGRHLFLICGPTGAGKTTILMPCAMRCTGKPAVIEAALGCAVTMLPRHKKQKSFLIS